MGLRRHMVWIAFAASLWMIGESARMLVEGIRGTMWYRPDAFDMAFDWLPMILLGVVLFWISVVEVHEALSR